jgi:hypothetical protein
MPAKRDLKTSPPAIVITSRPDEIVSRVHGWNARKRKIITAAHIKIAYERLVTEGWCQPVSVNA